MNTISDRVKNRINATTGQTEHPQDTATLFEDLGFDSLDLVEATLAIEDEFGIEIQDHEAEGLITVGDVIALVTKKLVDLD